MTERALSLLKDTNYAGPVFSRKDGRVYVKVSQQDETRPVFNSDTRALIEHAVGSSEYADVPVQVDENVFVPIFCKECYGTRTVDYDDALQILSSLQPRSFIVGVCCVFGREPDEPYTEATLKFFVSNKYAYSGACHRQPGLCLFLHENKKEIIGRVHCYWHVHSKSADKTFLYCCVECAQTEYVATFISQRASFGPAFSLGTVSDDEGQSPITEECSLVSHPRRPGCWASFYEPDELSKAMTRLGFCVNKHCALEAGWQPEHTTDGRGVDPRKGIADTTDGTGVEPFKDIADTIRALKNCVLVQKQELMALKDILRATKIHNSLLTQRLKNPSDPDLLLALRGAKDFTARTGIPNGLCAGINEPRGTIDTSEIGSDVCDKFADSEKLSDAAAGNTSIVPPNSNMDGGQAPVQTPNSNNPLETLVTTMLQQITASQQQQQQQQPAAQSSQQQQQLNSAALFGLLHLVPMLLNTQRGAPQQLLTPDGGVHHRFQSDRFGVQPRSTGYPVHGSSDGKCESSAYESLTPEQKRSIAIEYNERESEKAAARQKDHEKLMDTVKDSVRSVLKEIGTPGAPDDAEDGLQNIAKETPYKRPKKTAKPDSEAHDDHILPGLIAELKELKQLYTNGRQPSGGEPTDAEHAGADSVVRSCSSEAEPVIPPKNADLVLKAGIAQPVAVETQGRSVADFISVAVSKSAK